MDAEFIKRNDKSNNQLLVIVAAQLMDVIIP